MQYTDKAQHTKLSWFSDQAAAWTIQPAVLRGQCRTHNAQTNYEAHPASYIMDN